MHNTTRMHWSNRWKAAIYRFPVDTPLFQRYFYLLIV